MDAKTRYNRLWRTGASNPSWPISTGMVVYALCFMPGRAIGQAKFRAYMLLTHP